MADLIQKRGYRKRNATISEGFAILFILLFSLALCVAFLIPATLVLITFGEDAYSAFIGITSWAIIMSIFAPTLYYLDVVQNLTTTLYTPFLLRYSHYAQTPQFQSKTKRRQVLMLDAWRRNGAILSLVAILLIFEGLLATFIIYRLLTGEPNASNPLHMTILLVLIPLPFFFTSLPRRLLYNRYIAKHGPMPQETTDIVDKAWELYPDPRKKSKQPKPANAGE